MKSKPVLKDELMEIVSLMQFLSTMEGHHVGFDDITVYDVNGECLGKIGYGDSGTYEFAASVEDEKEDK